MVKFPFSFLILLIIGLSFNVYAQPVNPADSLINNRSSFKTYIPGIIALTYGVVALNDGPLKNLDHDIRNRRNEKRPGFHTYTDDYLRYLPYLAVMGMDAIGIQGKSEFKDKAGLMLGSITIAYGSAHVLKNIVKKRRPNGEDNKSFPSGHATMVFAGAEMFNQEYGDSSPWYSIASYTVASATAVLRVYNNDHWFSDVVAGAGVGILSTKLAYLIYPGVKKILIGKGKSPGLNIYPAYEQKTMSFTIVGKL